MDGDNPFAPPGLPTGSIAQSSGQNMAIPAPPLAIPPWPKADGRVEIPKPGEMITSQFDQLMNRFDSLSSEYLSRPI